MGRPCVVTCQSTRQRRHSLGCSVTVSPAENGLGCWFDCQKCVCPWATSQAACCFLGKRTRPASVPLRQRDTDSVVVRPAVNCTTSSARKHQPVVPHPLSV